jgi:protein SCO1/2
MKNHVKTILITMWVIAGLGVGVVAAGVWFLREHDGAQGAAPQAKLYADPSDADQATRLRPMFDAPDFKLIDQEGAAFGSAQLHGKVWVADFVFTGCSGLCPLMTQQMSEFQKQTAGSPVQMVSFSVDPKNDTPPVLAKYAQQYKADLSRWHFLTGEKQTLWQISNAMKLAVGPGDDHQIMHSSHFLLVDRNGHVRGVYDYKDAGFMARLVADAAALVNEH